MIHTVAIVSGQAIACGFRFQGDCVARGKGDGRTGTAVLIAGEVGRLVLISVDPTSKDEEMQLPGLKSRSQNRREMARRAQSGK